jgi:hypothetical protein
MKGDALLLTLGGGCVSKVVFVLCRGLCEKKPACGDSVL